MEQIEEWSNNLKESEEVLLFGTTLPLTIRRDFRIDNAEIKSALIIFSNIQFDGVVVFQDSTIKGMIQFEDCSFDIIVFKNCLFEGNQEINNLSFNNCTFASVIKLDNCRSDKGGVYIGTAGKVDHILINDCNLGNGNIRIECEIEIGIELVNVLAGSISISDRLDSPPTIAKSNSSSSIYFSDVKANGGVDISNKSGSLFSFQRLELDNDFKMKKCDAERFILQNPISKFNLKIIDSNFRQEFSCLLIDDKNFPLVYGCELNFIQIINCDLGKNAIIAGGAWEKSLLAGLSIDGTRVTETILTISDLQISGLRLAYDRSIKDLRLSNLKVGTLSMDGLRNSGELNFSNIVPYGENLILYIASSQPGNWKLINCNLKALKRVVIEGSDLLGLRYASVEWFNREALQYDGVNAAPIVTYTRWQHFKRNYFERVPREDREAAAARNRREVYRMLKEAAENQKDRFRALRFQQEEMKAQGEYLRLTQRFYSPERFVFWAGNSNNHGLNWWKPVLFAVGFTLLFFIILVCNTDPQMLRKPFFSAAGQEQLWSHWGIIPQMMNPVHAFDKMFPGIKSIPDSSWLIDYLHRLLMAFFIVQTVSAFRKYMKG